ncbi:hypothetical protein B0H10DRAFT_1950818 [Mycena sp. CBHHK59/15]|nr:hypothetical protein B0H10DRAFT_1950818 [Mycena sp. CBHHK59/15]
MSLWTFFWFSGLAPSARAFHWNPALCRPVETVTGPVETSDSTSTGTVMPLRTRRTWAYADVIHPETQGVNSLFDSFTKDGVRANHLQALRPQERGSQYSGPARLTTKAFISNCPLPRGWSSQERLAGRLGSGKVNGFHAGIAMNMSKMSTWKNKDDLGQGRVLGRVPLPFKQTRG